MKILTTSLIRLSIYDLRREGMLSPGRVVAWHRSCHGRVVASLHFVVGEDRLTICDADRRPLYDIKLSKTAVYLGGTRPWLHCPRCGRRCAVLYSDGEGPFACRQCRRLAYPSQNLSDAWRLLRQAQKIQRKLGWNGLEGGRPKGMRKSTYRRLVELHDDYDRRAMIAMVQSLNL